MPEKPYSEYPYPVRQKKERIKLVRWAINQSFKIGDSWVGHIKRTQKPSSDEYGASKKSGTGSDQESHKSNLTALERIRSVSDRGDIAQSFGLRQVEECFDQGVTSVPGGRSVRISLCSRRCCVAFC